MKEGSMKSLTQWEAIDRRIWEEELEEFVPQRIFDAHTHIFKPEHCLQTSNDIPPRPDLADKEMNLSFLREYFDVLLPKREIHYLLIGFPFIKCDFDRLNTFVAVEATEDMLSAPSMVVHPQMHPKETAAMVEKHSFVGFKPYRWYSTTGDAVECSITDMLPESLIEVANDKHLLITLHLSKRSGIADKDNIKGLRRLSQRYCNVQWILAHCARSFNPWFLEKAIEQIRDLPNVWYDTSAVCDSGVFDILLRNISWKRILYGSDALPGSGERGKYIAFAYGWALLREDNHRLDLSHCESRMTFALYEELRALRRAAQNAGLTETQLEDIFYNNAIQLLKTRAERTNQ
ncbi:MAG: amidohydrolase family protein [Candidatus Latescibacteria bacterium]|nr:amidohydrolase family protein [Candidatus Latescibacterota bacterium]